ncbi:MAG: hypothetical protein JWO38_215 [Gemmataceae bacterium]|nr:hypothetical protein [Gemmataceae bacterium]
MRRPLPAGRARVGPGLLALLLATSGCGTTRMTDTNRAASEMLLISQAVDHAVAKIDFTPLAGQPVFLDTSAVDKDTVDKGYLVSVVRQQLLAYGALVQEERFRAVYVVEIRSGGLGTNRHSLLVGTPAMSLPTIVPGLPSASVPELALVKRSDQRGVAKIGVFAYNRISGRALWQSGTVDATSHSNDTWVFGAGPFSRGTIRQRTELAGEPLPTFPLMLFKQPGESDASTPSGPSREQFFPAGTTIPPSSPIPAAILGVTGAAALGDLPVVR